jgi:hypothetical protein
VLAPTEGLGGAALVGGVLHNISGHCEQQEKYYIKMTMSFDFEIIFFAATRTIIFIQHLV